MKKIKKNKNVNWIIKAHPAEIFYKTQANTRSIFNEYIKEKQNVRLFPTNYKIGNIYKFIDVAITSHGSAGYQYPILGIPTIIAGETPYSDAQFNLQPKTKKDYFKLLSNINSINSLGKIQQDKSKVFWYLFNFLFRIEIPTIYRSNIHMDYDKKKFWKKTLSLLKTHGSYQNNFFKSLNYQIVNDNGNFVNLKKLLINKINLKSKTFS